MTDPLLTFERSGLKAFLSTDAKIKFLDYDLLASGATGSGHDRFGAGANYQVPVGKKFIIMVVKVGSGNRPFSIWESTTVDTEDGTEHATAIQHDAQDSDMVVGAGIEFAAGKYVTLTNDHGGSAFTGVWYIVGIEVDA